MRDAKEILRRIEDVKVADMFGFEQEPLVDALPFASATAFLKEGVTEAQWLEGATLTDEAVRKAAVDYLDFAWSKALDHRGLSASRSVSKMRSYLWLLGLNVARFDGAAYAQYGAPQLRVATEELAQPIPNDPALVRMMDGESCGADYECGCGG